MAMVLKTADIPQFHVLENRVRFKIRHHYMTIQYILFTLNLKKRKPLGII